MAFPLIPLIGTIGGLIGDFMTSKREKAKAKQELDLAIIKGKQKLAEGEQSHNSSWELEALRVASKPLRWVVSVTILAPIWYTIYDPVKGKEVFTTFKDVVPAEWWGLFLIMCAFVYASKNLIEIVKSVQLFKR